MLPPDAEWIDRKIDDGRPFLGRVIVVGTWTPLPSDAFITQACVYGGSSPNDTAAVYNLTGLNDYGNCALGFAFQ